MNEEEKKAIEILKSVRISLMNFNEITEENKKVIESIQIIADLIEKQQKEIEKLRNNNKNLLRKLRNRVKEVKKLTKYSLYKKEFSTLNEHLKKKDKIIDLMVEKLKQLREASLEDCFIPRSYRDIDDCLKTTCEECIKQYFERKVEG